MRIIQKIVLPFYLQIDWIRFNHHQNQLSSILFQNFKVDCRKAGLGFELCVTIHVLDILLNDDLHSRSTHCSTVLVSKVIFAVVVTAASN